MKVPRVVAIVGPTGSGKARLARALAERSDALLLSCDSMKVYRRMDVGTAKPAPDERARWRGLDLVEPWESYDAARFKALFEECLAEARETERALVLSGGTMLYLKAATEGLGDAPPRDAALRAALKERAQREDLHARLAEVDPASAARVHPNDERRVVRALEVFELTGRPLSSFQGNLGRPRRDLERRVFVVTRARADMDARIDRRVERMIERGWVEECEALAADPRGVSREAGQALGYPQLFDWLASGRPRPLEEVVTKIQTLTRRFARRQLTWIRNLQESDRREECGQGSVHAVEVAEGEEPLGHLDDVLLSLE